MWHGSRAKSVWPFSHLKCSLSRYNFLHTYVCKKKTLTVQLLYNCSYKLYTISFCYYGAFEKWNFFRVMFVVVVVSLTYKLDFFIYSCFRKKKLNRIFRLNIIFCEYKKKKWETERLLKKFLVASHIYTGVLPSI